MEKISIKRSAIGTASGAIDVFGGIAKAGGALSLQIQPEPKTTVLATEVNLAAVRVTSTAFGRFDCDSQPFTESQRDDFAETTAFIGWLNSSKAPDWARQALGCLHFVCQRFGWSPDEGINLSIASDLPVGIGVGSGIALKVATIKALAKLSGCYIGPQDLAEIVQKVDTEVMGRTVTPDRSLTSIFGKPGHLLPIDTRTGTMMTTVELPKGVTLYTWSRPTEDTLFGTNFRRGCIGAAMGAKALSKSGPAAFAEALPSPSTFSRYKDVEIPETLSGDQFHQEFSSSDSLIPIPQGGEIFPVKAALNFSIRENHRAIQALHLLSSMAHRHKRKTVELIGELLFESHYELQSQGFGSSLAETMVNGLLDAGPDQGIFGARASGEGHGCSVVVLADKKSIAVIRQLARQIFPDTEDPSTIL